ncbi:hypothetical protein EV426DRAFT_708939 [Tirmania nivea]|nr:hypothetical protein EV426DRAFT_708939 [Tirmania nivea]
MSTRRLRLTRPSWRVWDVGACEREGTRSPTEGGYYIAFACTHHRQQRQELIGDAMTWEDLHVPIWKKEEGEEEEWDAVEAYFAYLYRPIARC